MSFDQPVDAPARFAGGDAEQHALIGMEIVKNGAGAGKERLLMQLAVAELPEGRFVGISKTLLHVRALGWRELAHGIDEGEADDAVHGRARRRGYGTALEGSRQRGGDHGLAVDERAVAVEDHEIGFCHWTSLAAPGAAAIKEHWAAVLPSRRQCRQSHGDTTEPCQMPRAAVRALSSSTM